MIAQGASREAIENAGGLLFSTASMDTIGAQQLVKMLNRGGYLKGKTIGIVGGSDAASRDTIENGYKPALKAAGLEVVDEQVLSCGTTNNACGGYPNAVQSFKRSGVDLVLSTLGALSYPAFVAEANQQEFHPQYTATPISGMTTNVVAKQQEKNGTAFDGALGAITGQGELLTDSGSPPAFNEECAKIYTAHGGPRLTKSKAPDQYGGLGTVCAIVRVLEHGLEGAGKNPTPESFSKAVRKLRRVSLNGGDVGSFGPNKFTAVDNWSLAEWHKDCVCWLPVSSAAKTGSTRP
jgi:ABC-type branched-subunit amino acid transport system substrate-binding protein